jgi:hypothetical protein
VNAAQKNGWAALKAARRALIIASCAPRRASAFDLPYQYRGRDEFHRIGDMITV